MQANNNHNHGGDCGDDDYIKLGRQGRQQQKN